jgi:hypothetical protein
MNYDNRLSNHNVKSFNNIAPPPSYESSITNDNNRQANNKSPNTLNNTQREDKYREIIRRHEISIDFAQKLQYLQGIF